MYPTTYRKTFEDLPTEIQREVLEITEELLRAQVAEKMNRTFTGYDANKRASTESHDGQEQILRTLCRNDAWKVKKKTANGEFLLTYER